MWNWYSLYIGIYLKFPGFGNGMFIWNFPVQWNVIIWFNVTNGESIVFDVTFDHWRQIYIPRLLTDVSLVLESEALKLPKPLQLWGFWRRSKISKWPTCIGHISANIFSNDLRSFANTSLKPSERVYTKKYSQGIV